jgi:hypothetical protein
VPWHEDHYLLQFRIRYCPLDVTHVGLRWCGVLCWGEGGCTAAALPVSLCSPPLASFRCCNM